MMPKLLAEESMRETERLAVGMGLLAPDAARRITQRWNTDAETVQAAAKRPLGPGGLEAYGIGVTVVGKAHGR